MTDNKQNARKQAQRRARQRKQRNRRIALTACLMIAVMVASIGGTLAWLTDQTAPVVNTFTVGDINIELTETTGALDTGTGKRDYEFVPGDTLAKDPKVSVTAGSEACYLFVHVVENNNTVLDQTSGEKVINWSIANGWDQVVIDGETKTGYYYREVDADTAKTGDGYYVLSGTIANPNGQVTVSKLVTKGMHTTLTANKPTLTFTAAAIQSDNVTDYADAWSKLPTDFTGETGA